MDLTALYAAVPAAEEEDLLEEVREERRQREWDALLASSRPALAWRPAERAPEPVDEGLAQVLALLELRLGARVLPD